MNKTTTANIGGVVFHIDIDAFDKLQQYLSAISRYFDSSEGKDEIMADVEARIAELLKERKSNPSQVIVLEDVNAVIRIMGEPEQYADPVAEEAYDGYDRGKRYSYEYKKRRLFRDPDNRTIGGVCSGIAHYFGIDPVWLRIFFLIAFFGWGSGLLLYIILWIVIPEAKTTAEKLEMRGEPINVDNIGRTIDEEMNKMKDQFNKFAERTRNMDTKKKVSDIENGLGKFFHFLGNIFTGLFNFLGKALLIFLKVIGKIVGFAFFIAGVLLLIFLLGMLFNASSILSITSEGFHYYSLHQLFGYISSDPAHWVLLIIATILFLGIPVIAIVYGGIRLLFPSRSNVNTRGTGIVLFFLWLAGLVITIFLGFQIGTEFRNEARVEENIDILPFQGKVLHIDVNDDLFADAMDDNFDDKYSFQFRGKDGEIELLRYNNLLFQKDGKEVFAGIPRLIIRKSNTDRIQLILKKYADGVTSRQAESRARAIQYNIEQQDSLLLLDPIFRIEDELLFRDQSMRMELLIPENTILDMSPATENLVYNMGNLSGRWVEKSYSNWHWRVGGYKWMMLEDGLICLNCEESATELLDSLQLEIVNNIEL